MFRRLWTGLPKDAVFASGLEGLGARLTARRTRYFINQDDEVRSIENPDNYFKFFVNRNPRVNQRQRFEFDAALRGVIHQRLLDEGLEMRRLPLGAGPDEPHVCILASPDLARSTRVVVLFGEPTHHLGVLAGRVASGPGGINKGSMVSVVRELRGQAPSPPAMVIADPAELYWWPEGRRGLTVADSAAIPLPSLVHAGRRYRRDRNGVPGNGSPAEHVAYMFDVFLRRELGAGARLSVVAVGQSCELVTGFLDDVDNAARWLGNMDGMLLLGTVYPVETLRNDHLRSFLAKRSRAYIISPEPVNTPLAPPTGNPEENIPPLGSPSYSSAEPFYTERILISALQPALRYLADVASPDYQNDEIVLAEKPPEPLGLNPDTEDWHAVPEDEKPIVGVADADSMREQVSKARRFRKILETGRIPDSDSSDDDAVL
ncbi:hypothetical protein E4U42_004993 [Claviceps africana]|uniref:Arb2 domain-containing protein n=1 Tax=Claviceps africana TaxID=83212 RepID=A0A8K0J6L3_9HYPO|nr:hypothetical protein E4U42_004993 [Claviceps africana]